MYPTVTRPSTSPMPLLHINRKASMSRLPPAAALRPLPPARQHMCIEGHSTGEERTAPLLERREPRRQSTPAGAKEERTATELHRIRKLETELKRLRDVLKRKNGEIEDLREEATRLKDSISTAQQRVASTVQESAREVSERETIITQLRSELESERRTALRKCSDDDSRVKRLTDLLAERDGTIHSERKSAQAREEALQAQLKDSNAKIARSEEALRTLQSDLHASRSSRDGSSAALLSAKAQHEKDTKELRAALSEERKRAEASAATLDEWKARIQKCDKYIVQICQPQFSVVKDDSLAPMPTDNSDPHDGFVLVPLKLMLEGYGLLPETQKEMIASRYEDSKRS